MDNTLACYISFSHTYKFLRKTLRHFNRDERSADEGTQCLVYFLSLADSPCEQVEDLLGMQACNLQNLPENYTMRYCKTILQVLSCREYSK